MSVQTISAWVKRGRLRVFEVRTAFIVMLLVVCGCGSVVRSGAAEPVCEMAGTAKRFPGRYQAAFLKRRAEVACLLVPNHCAGIVLGLEILADKLVKWENVRSGDFKYSI
jgi:hypothetical protein